MDPYSLLKSDTLNKINSIYGNNIIIRGFDLTTMQASNLKLILKPGTAIKDSVLITMKEEVVIYLMNSESSFTAEMANNSALIVLTYQYDKIKPAPIAKIEFIKEENYDPEIHLQLYRIVFDANGMIDTVVRSLQPKDNVIYEEMLNEIQSVSISAVKNTLSELGNEGIADLLEIYMRMRGTSIGGDYSSISKYYLLKTIDKYNYKNVLNINIAIKKASDYFYNSYVFTENGVDLQIHTESLTTVNELKKFADYANVFVYDDGTHYKIYADLNGEISGNIEVYESIYNSDTVTIDDISVSEAPDLTKEILVWNARTVNKISTNTYVNDYIIWNESNMGSGSGLDADLLDNHDSTYFASQLDILNMENRINATIVTLANQVTEVGSTSENAIPRIEKARANGVATLNEDAVVPATQLDVKVIDGVVFHADDAAPVGTTRLNCEGNFYATKIYNATFKDVAECFDTNAELNFENCKNRIMVLDYATNKARLSRKYDNLLLGVVSDTYGFLLGGTQEEIDSNANLVPIAMCGTVYVELESMEDNRNYSGCLVGPGQDGYGIIVTRNDPYVGMIVDWNYDSTLVKILVKLHY